MIAGRAFILRGCGGGVLAARPYLLHPRHQRGDDLRVELATRPPAAEGVFDRRDPAEAVVDTVQDDGRSLARTRLIDDARDQRMVGTCRDEIAITPDGEH